MAEGQNLQLNMALVMKVGTERGEKATNHSNHGRRSLSLRSRNCNVFSVDEVYGMDRDLCLGHRQLSLQFFKPVRLNVDKV